MSQTNYTPIQLYRTTTASLSPSAGNLADGELGINLTDEKLYFKNAGGTVKLLAANLMPVANGGTGVTTSTGSGSVVLSTSPTLVTPTLVTPVLGTPASGNFSTGTFTWPTFNQNTTGTANNITAYTINQNVGTSNSPSFSGLTLSGGTANGVLYLNGSKVATSGSGLTFDGSNLGIGTASPSSKLHVTGGADPALTIQGDISGGGAYLTFSADANLTKAQIYGNKEGGSGGRLQFFTSNSSGTSTEVMRLDSSGNLGLGVTPSAWGSTWPTIQVKNASFTGTDALNDFAAMGANLVATSSSYPTDSSVKYISNGYATSYRQLLGSHQWYTAPSGTAGNAITFTQAMTLDSSGNLLVGTTSSEPSYPGAELGVSGYGRFKRDSAEPLIANRIGSTGTIVLLQSNTGAVGTISTNGTTTSYNTSSDYRLKEDIQPVATPIDRLSQLKPVNFAWKLNGERCDGFLAHELQEVIPEAATGHKDEMRTEEYEVTPAINDEEGNVITEAVMGEREVPVYQGIDQSKIVPLLTAALQEAVTKIESLTQRIEALEDKGE